MKKKREDCCVSYAKCHAVIKFVKLVCFFWLLSISTSYASLRAQTVTLKKQNATLEEIIWELKQRTNIVFMYSDDDIASITGITINEKNANINEILHKCLIGTGLEFVEKNETIVIKKHQETSSPVITPKGITVTGTVCDKNGQPMPGVTVIIVGTTIGVATDLDGHFTILAGSSQDSLQFSFIGMKTQTVRLGNKNVLTVVLEDDVAEMEEVVVNGYFSKNKDSFTGSVVAISKDELAKVSSNNLISALQVFDPSFRLQENVDMGSNPNSLPDFRIRGDSGLGANLSESNLKNDPNLPTFILDGYEVKVEKVFDLNIDRIENITILKDASATAIYGSRAANGIVVITTKAPEPGELRVSYNFTMSVIAPDLSDYDLLNSREKLEAERLSGYYQSNYIETQQALDMDYAERLKNIERGVDTYWLSQPLRTAVGHKHSLYIEGGDKSIRYGIDVNYQGNPGVMKKSSRDRLGLGFLLSYNLNNKLLFRNKLSVDKIKSQESPYGSFSAYAKANPYNPIYDERGHLIKEYKQHVSTTHRFLNPLYEAQLNHKDQSQYTEFTNNFDLDWFINDNFRLKGRLSYSERNDKRERFIDPESSRYESSDYQTGEGLLKKGEAYNFDEKSSNLDANVVLTYTQQFGNHYLNGALGGNIIESKFENESYSVVGFPAGNMDYVSFGKEFKNLTPDGTESLSRLAGTFLNVNYTYNNTYMLDVSARIDGSSQYGSEKRFAPFWSAGLGWNIHNEKFFKKVTGVMNHLKLTANVGETGKASFSAYEAQNVFEFYKGQWYAGGLGASVVALGNPNLQWEKTRNYGANLEMQFLDGRISIDANYYLKRTTDLLADIALPLSNGFETYRDNLGELDNRGYEISVRTFPIRNDVFVLNVYGTAARNKNEIRKISNSLQTKNEQIDKEQDTSMGEAGRYETAKPVTQFKEGESTTTIYAVRSMGINPMNGRELFLTRDGDMTYQWSAADKVACGDTEPKISGAFGANGDYKGFSLSVNFLYQFGGQVYNQTLVDRVEDANIRDNVDRRVLSARWKQVGDRTFFKDIKSRTRTEITSRMVQDENILQLQSMSLSYSFPQHLSKKLYMERLKLTFLMEDVFRFSNIRRERGLDYPFARTFNFGLQVQF